ncbi:MAG: hypothetical protein ABJO36_10400 [Litorimonas sp.]
MTYSKFMKVTLAAFLLASPAVIGISAAADIVHNDDVIIDGSLCVGLDCVNGEAFGFDTIRLKENNLRIHFDDTSTAASFPRTDWRIEINSSSNGGASYFGIEDASIGRMPFQIRANAPSNSLFVSSSGNVGMGTSSPVANMHSVDGDTPTLRLEQNGSSGFTPQTWDLAGNETNFFIRDVSNGSALPFRIFPGADSSALVIADDSQIGFGLQSPRAPLHIFADDAGVKLDSGSSGEWDIFVQDSDGEFAIDDDSTMGSDFIFKTADTADNSPWEFVHRADNGLGINIGTSLGADFILSDNGDLSVLGTITSSGPTCGGGCDAVFDSDYQLPTIEEHAEAMFTKRHLPTVGPTSPDAQINLTEHMGNVLNELEKAHIYIAQLNERNKALETELAESKNSFESRLKHLEQSLK